MDLGISGKIAFVAGGSKGIGKAAALQLGAEGCNVAVVARERGSIDAAVAEIVAAGGSAAGISADLSTPEGAEAAVAATHAAFGWPDIVIGQTNELKGRSFWKLKNEDFEESFRIFTMSTIYLARAVLPHMKAQKWGRFVHIGSPVAKEPEMRFPHILANVARPSTSGLLKSLADELAVDGVTINTVAPGWTLTPVTLEFLEKSGMTLAQGEEWLRKTIGVPAGRFATADEIASMVVFLCSDRASYVTGGWVLVDGGMHRTVF